jgi:hypothetical protein
MYMRICVSGIDFASLSTICFWDFGAVLTMYYFFSTFYSISLSYLLCKYYHSYSFNFRGFRASLKARNITPNEIQNCILFQVWKQELKNPRTNNVSSNHEQPEEIKFTSRFPMVDDSLQLLRLRPPLKLVAMI